MSIELLNSVFDSIHLTGDWSLQLLRISTPKREGTKYVSRQITLDPPGTLNTFVKELAQRYRTHGKGSLDSYNSLIEYDGTADAMTIYKLHKDNPLIASEFESFITAVANPDVEEDAMTFSSAYLVKGTLTVDGEQCAIKLISMQNPITSLSHKFYQRDGKFSEIRGPVLSLRKSVDVVIIQDTVYFLTMAGENLFNMARAYKNVCHDAVIEVEGAGFISGIERFKGVAESGHNPRRFVSFNRDRLEALKNTNTRKAMAKQFAIPLDTDNKFDASIDGASEKIVKLLCNKGMIDPFKKTPVEVTGAKQWQ